MINKLREKVADLPRYEPQGEPDHHNGAAWMAEDQTGEFIRRDDVLAALGAAPQPAPDREALVEHDERVQKLGAMIFEAVRRGLGNLDAFEAMKIADDLLAHGLRLPGGDETMAWAVVREDGALLPATCGRGKPVVDQFARAGQRVVRVAIRVVEGGDDA